MVLMTKERVKLSIALLIPATLGFFFLQYLYIARSYNLEKKEFDFFARIMVNDAFFKVSMDKNSLEKYSALLLDYKEKHQRLPGQKIIRENLAKILQPYRETDALLEERFRQEKIDIQFRYAVTVNLFELQGKDGKVIPVIDQAPTGEESILVGNLQGHQKEKVPGKARFSTSFYYTGGQYYIQINYYIDFPKLGSYLLKKIRPTIIISAVSALILLVIVLFIIRTMLSQKKLSQMKTDFINNLTHEINTPISTIDVAARSLINHTDRMDHHSVKNMGEMIARQNKRLQELTSNVMKLSFMETGSGAWSFEEIELHSLLVPLVEDFRVGNRAKGLQIDMQLDAAPSRTTLDKISFESALLNIMENAIKYCERPPNIKISTKNKGEQLVLTVEDNGIGMSREEQKKIFHKFYRVHRGDLHRVKGLGLGLYNAAIIIKAHSGRIQVRSTPGTGSVFEIYIPRSKNNDEVQRNG